MSVYNYNNITITRYDSSYELDAENQSEKVSSKRKDSCSGNGKVDQINIDSNTKLEISYIARQTTENHQDYITKKIHSRKISLKSLSRHFAAWKIRAFTIDKNRGILGIERSSKPMVYVELSAPSVSIGRHYYHTEGHLLYLKYHDQNEDCAKEIIMKFTSEEELLEWQHVIHSTSFH